MTGQSATSKTLEGDRAPGKVSPTRHRQFLIILAGLFLVGQEVLLRLLFPVPEVENFNRIQYSVFLPEKGKKPQPLRNADYLNISEPDGFNYVHSLNLYGFRDDDWTLKAAPGRRRVAFVGDSFTEGAGAPQGSTLVDGFDAAGPGGKIETMNLGIQGTGVREYLKLLNDAVPLFRPDHVVLVLMANEFGRIARPDARLL